MNIFVMSEPLVNYVILWENFIKKKIVILNLSRIVQL